jgi:hypothetical protein
MAPDKDRSAEETADPNYADTRNFFKVELWTKDNQRVARMLFAGNRLERAIAIFEAETRRRPGGRYLLRQRARVLRKWPQD